MSEQLKLVLNKLNIAGIYQEEFKDASLLDVVLDEKKKSVKVILVNKTNLSCDLYFELREKLKEYFSGYKVNLLVEVKEVNNEYFKDYFYKCIENIARSNPLINVFSDRLIATDNSYLVEVINKAEETQVSSFIKDLNSQMKIFGYQPNIKISISEEKRTKIVENISNDLKVDIKAVKKEVIKQESPRKRTGKDANSIYGYPIKDNPVAIRSIIGEETEFVLKGKSLDKRILFLRVKSLKLLL